VRTVTKTVTTPAPKTNPNAGLSRQVSSLQQQLRALRNELKASTKANKPSSHGSSPSTSGNSGSGSSGSGSSGSSTSGGGGGGGSGGTSGSGASGGGSATEIMQTSSTELVVTVDLSASLQSEATMHEHVTVEMPNGSNVAGRITAISSVAQSSGDSGDSGGGAGGGSGGSGSGGSGSATVPITITLDKRAKGAGLDQAAVSVDFTQAKASHVLSVPVTALIATPGQHFAVQEASSPHKLIPVTTGLFAAGYVQISGSGIYSGMSVTDSQG
jgi:hypothetical protein